MAAADIPASKLGPARSDGLTGPERELYLWILRRFAATGRPSSAAIREEARALRVEFGHALATLARGDLIHLGADGEIAVAYPFSGRPTAHRVRFKSGHEVDAMCAIDALGIAPMFAQPIEITSRDPVTEEQIHVQLAPDGQGRWRPESTVVVSGAMGRQCESFCSCCRVLNFFAKSANGRAWLAQHPDVRGEVVSMPDAINAGRAVFGDVLA